jgi:hypothetical protein
MIGARCASLAIMAGSFVAQELEVPHEVPRPYASATSCFAGLCRSVGHAGVVSDRSNQTVLTTGPTVLEFYNGTDGGGWAISSLSAAAVKNFTTFTGSGVQSRVAFTAGLYFRF